MSKTTDNLAGERTQDKKLVFNPTFGMDLEDNQAAADLQTAVDYISELETQRDNLLAALRDIETRAGYSLARPDKSNNDIQMDYIRQQAGNAIAATQQETNQ